MRVFIDACIDPRIVECFDSFEVQTSFEMGWQQLKDSILVQQLHGLFDVLITADRGFEHEHNLTKLGFGIVIIHVMKNKIEFYRPLCGLLREAARSVQAGEIKHVHGSVKR